MLLRSAVYLLVYLTLTLNMAIPLLRPNFDGPLVTRLKGFHCTSVDKGTARVKISSQIKKCYAMTLVRVQIQMIESEVWHTDYQATYFLCDIDEISKSPVLIQVLFLFNTEILSYSCLWKTFVLFNNTKLLPRLSFIFTSSLSVKK